MDTLPVISCDLPEAFKEILVASLPLLQTNSINSPPDSVRMGPFTVSSKSKTSKERSKSVICLKLAAKVNSIDAIDISHEMLKIAEKKLSMSALKNVKYSQADIERCSVNTIYDTVVTFSLLHLVDNVQKTLSIISSLIKPGGTFISKTVCIKERNIVMIGVIRLMTKTGFAPRVYPMSTKELILEIEKSGFEIVEVCFFDRKNMSPFIVAKRPK